MGEKPEKYACKGKTKRNFCFRSIWRGLCQIIFKNDGLFSVALEGICSYFTFMRGALTDEHGIRKYHTIGNSTEKAMTHKASNLSRIAKILSHIRIRFQKIVRLPDELRDLRDLIFFQQTKQLQSAHPNPLNKYGKKCFSQNDEDGITLEILKRIGVISKGVFAEFGVGNGTENNTLILAALGWRGFWVGGEDLVFNYSRSNNKKFSYIKEWITLANIADLTIKGLSQICVEELDVVSLDLDGNDIYFVEKLLSNKVRPKLFIVEYNAKFLPPVEFQISYDPQHIWRDDDYFGASLCSFNKLFSDFNYRLVCCNSQPGANAFFIDAAYSNNFSDVPADINQVYVEPRYCLYHKYGHKPSLKVIEKIFNG